jgi:hypothetical protein
VGWTTRAVHRVVLNDVYTGKGGYPPIIERARWERIVAARRRLDPGPDLPVERRRSRPPREVYLLRGVATCARCGGSLHTRRYAAGRHYLCGEVRLATGECDLPRFLAAPIEDQALRHLRNFKGDVRQWLDRQIAERRTEVAPLEAAAGRERQALARLERLIAKAQARYDAALAADDDARAGSVEEDLMRLRDQRRQRERELAEAEARVAEWTAEPDVDAAIDHYAEVYELINGRLAHAHGAAEVNEGLRELLASMSVDVRGDLIVVKFTLRDDERTLVRLAPLRPVRRPVKVGRRPSCTTTR